MTAEAIHRTQLIQQTVLAYFRAQPDEAVVRPRPQLPALVEVELRGQLAAKFESASESLDGDPARRILRLLFDRQYASVAHRYELVAPGSPLLRLMLNDLAETAPFTRSAVLFNIDGNYQDLQQLGVDIRHGRPQAQVRLQQRRFYLILYLVRLTSYEKTEDLVPVLVDAASCRPLDAALTARVAGANLGDLTEAAFLPKIPPPDGQEVRRVIAAADQAAEQRIKASLAQRCADLARKNQEERQRIEQHFEIEINRAAESQQDELRRQRDQSLRETEARYTVKTEATLVSVQEVVAPCVSYSLLLDGRAIEQRFRFDPLQLGQDSLQTTACPTCHQHLIWDYCTAGRHLVCGACGQAVTCCVPDCGVAACPQHVVRCADAACQRAVCQQHAQACDYCDSNRRYCGDHIHLSFEQRNICPQCATLCQHCQALFPPSQVAQCVVCHDSFCSTHHGTCPGCGKPYCAKHGHVPHVHTETYCLACLVPCPECDPSRLHVKAELRSCAVCSQRLCADHAIVCAGCGAALCGRHALSLPDGGWGCPRCFAPCTECGGVFPRDALVRCTVCPQLLCPDHARRSLFRGEPYCGTHAQLLFAACPGCDRQGPADQLQQCALCGVSYCPHCQPDDEPRCAYCRGLQPVQAGDLPELAELAAAVLEAGYPHRPPARAAVEIAKALRRGGYELTIARSHSHTIVLGSYRGGSLAFLTQLFHQVKEFVVTRERFGGRVQVRVLR